MCLMGGFGRGRAERVKGGASLLLRPIPSDLATWPFGLWRVNQEYEERRSNVAGNAATDGWALA